ncbi:class I SAM-dependent methyltransferase [Anditalea andensis]|uniref:SAM-dependent methyltransferase n=1 Tax=Anditalea andensis TaxID=1048983 RepID=A0A074LHI8_9BACT|nr:class I SAM-dependent methyltransferase [Anditalea andensis]KEO73252.1 SAM-dependent methyltransferase [Anditalea andensis]
MALAQKYTAELKKFVQDHLNEDPAHLLFKYHGSAHFDLRFAVQQISARQKVKTKLPSWVADSSIVFPETLSLEQSSSEAAARYKSMLMKGQKMVDLTGGLGIDTFYGGQNFEQVIYVERNEALCEIARHNFSHLAHDKFVVHHQESMAWLINSREKYDWIYIDPARRGIQNQKLYKLSDCEPDIVKHWVLLKQKAANLLVKASPILDIKAVLEELPDIDRVIVLSVKNEIKEILLLSEGISDKSEVVIECVELSSQGETFTFTYEHEGLLDLQLSQPKRFIIEPHASILKAGGFKSFSETYHIPKLHVNSHLYTSDIHIGNLLGRVYEILSEVKSDKKVIKKLFPSGKANVVVRNYPLKAEDIKNKFRLKDGGDDFLIASTTMEGKHRLFHCRKVI